MANKPTEEQQAILSAGGRTSLLIIEALAGTGKTTTLEMLSHQLSGKGLYLAFNRSIAEEAQSRFAGNVTCRTFHSLAFATMAPRVADRIEGKDNGTLSPMRIRKLLKLNALGPLNPLARAGMVRDTYNRYLYSPDASLMPFHVSDQAILNLSMTRPLTAADEQVIREQVSADAQRLWEAVWREGSQIPVTHDTYLKAFALASPTLPYDYIEVDESQDLNPMMLSMIERQPARLILVGDSLQSIYEYRGAVNALSTVERDDMQRCYLTQSFRFGSQIAGHANIILGNLGARHPLRGFDVDRSHLTGQTAHLYRSNMGMFSAVINHFRQEKGPFEIAGGTKDMVSLLKGVNDLMMSGASSHPDLQGFNGWSDFKTAAQQEGAPDEMLRLVKIVTQYPYKMLMAALYQGGKAQKGAPAECVFSTAHKSKGREWPVVHLGADFVLPESDLSVPMDAEEARLAYVAVTRAQRRLIGAGELLLAYRKRLEALAEREKSQHSMGALAARLRGMALAERSQTLDAMTPAERCALADYLKQEQGTPQ